MMIPNQRNEANRKLEMKVPVSLLNDLREKEHNKNSEKELIDDSLM